MKQLLISGWLGLFSALSVSAAISPIFINDSPVNSPPDEVPAIDATAWVNRSTFNISTASGTSIPLPFESQHTLFFTNTIGGVMIGNPGFRFFQNVGSQRLWMDTWTNNGTISADNSSTFTNAFGSFFGTSFSLFFGFDSQRSVLMVKSTNIASTGTGTLRSGAQGIIHLEGKKINLKRNGLRTGSAPQSSFFFGGGFLLSSNYVNDFGIFDVWWGAGTNNNVDNKGVPMRVNNPPGGRPQFNIPNPSSPFHQVIEIFRGSTFPFTNFVTLPQFNFGNYTAAVLTNQTGPTNFIVQVVFYPTNNIDTNFTTEVQFMGGFGASGASMPVVAFNSIDFDIVDQTYSTNSIYLSDALGTVTNVFLAQNFNGNTSRPDTYEISRIAPFGFGDPFFSSPGNAIFDPAMIWNPAYQYNTVTNLYAGYQAQIASVTTASGTSGDPTNFPGRIQIIGEEVDLDKTRIRAESALTLKATVNLTSNRLAKVDAPWVNFDVRSLAPTLTIANIAPATVHRLSGDIAAWSGIWKNYDTNSSPTNEILFHVLLVDPFIQTVQPVVVNEFAAHATNLIIEDVLTIGKSFLADAQGIDVKGGVIMPYGASWGATNMQNILNFTNEGNISITRVANAGADRPFPYDNYINRGTIAAATVFIRSTNFDNSGSIIANGGLLQLDTLTASMMGGPLTIFTNVFTNISFNPFPPFGFVTNVATNVFTNTFGALLQGNSDVLISADDLVVSNSFLQAGTVNQGSLIFSVTNRLIDSGQSGINHWLGTGGFQMRVRPVTSDLLGTYLVSRAAGFSQESFHTWSAENRGATVDGYNNNLALGKLTLDGADGSLFHFSAPAGQTNKALYVDYLELLNFATNYSHGALDISPDMTIYFANANLNPVKLDGSNGGRLRWVRDFAGPLSSTNITYPSGRTYTFNIALVQSKDLDSDGDGIVNADDPTPLPEPGSAGLSIAMSKTAPHTVQLSWRAKPSSVYRIEYLSAPAAINWQVLTNIINGPTNGILKAQDNSPLAEQRFYRIRVDGQ